MPETLKPCPVPWCGGAAYVYRMFGKQSRRARCKQCGLESATCATEAEAIAAWNKRPADAVIEAAQKVADATRKVQSFGSGDNHLNTE